MLEHLVVTGQTYANMSTHELSTADSVQLLVPVVRGDSVGHGIWFLKVHDILAVKENVENPPTLTPQVALELPRFLRAVDGLSDVRRI